MPSVSFEVEKRIGAPAERVWTVLADYARDREWRDGVEMRQDPPGLAVAGAITHESLRFLGSEMRVVARVEAVEPGRSLRFRTIESDVPVRGERRIEPIDGATSLVTIELEMEPSGVWAWFRAPLAALFRRRFARDLDRLAALLEAA